MHSAEGLYRFWRERALCTVIVSVEPEAEAPVLLVGVRDEFVTRPWMSPVPYWPEYPGLVGGRDLMAGGTWLAADPAGRRVAALLNGRGALAPQEVRRSRGDLPLRAAVAGELPPVDLPVYDPFHLVVAGLDGVRIWSWNGERLTEEKLPAGVHMLVNTGWERGDDNARVACFRSRFAAAVRPRWPGSGSTERFWGEWLPLASGAGLAHDDPRALLVRQKLDDGRIFATLSVTLIALAEGGMRYDFCPQPDDPASWHEVRTPG
ncbi:NRDE family protein [Planotetraspora sp. A-T 1434]|uniref:NRDE family protein n=1 Tax=Planotetraspora sp. A-T 1434 TaxID=2979219 RepID=UPI0021BE0564|nr:NRDE family protein [Planotetraspora sp. A-T 1434]MCT9932715.1 NRDE family protein [Planotetraspora sp. A-T 1434]